MTRLLERAFRAATRRPALVLGALLLAQTLPALASRDLTAPDEVRHADALRNLLHEGHAVVLHVNGAPYPDKPPVWFWAVAGVAKAIGEEGAPPFLLACALAGALLLAATVSAGRRVLGLDGGGALAAGAMLMTMPMFLLLSRTTRMDVAFSAAIVASETLLFLGLSADRPSGRTVAGFALAGLAALVKGPMGIAMPLAAAAAWLLATRRGGRLVRRDTLLGLAAVAVLLGAYAAAAEAAEGPGWLAKVWREQIVGRATGHTGPRRPFWTYLAALPAVALPWTALALVPSTWRPVADARRDGRRFLVAVVLSGVVLLSIPSSKYVNYLMPLLPALAILGAEALGRLSPATGRRFWSALGVGLLVVAAVVPFGDRLHPWPVALAGLVPIAALLAATGIATLVAARGGGPGAPLVVGALGVSAVALVASLVTAPSLDPVLSPRAQAETLAALGARGIEVVSYRVFPGTYAWHARRTIRETGDLQEVERLVASGRPAAVATAKRYLDREPERRVFAGMTVVHEQWIGEQPYVVLLREPPR